MENRSAAGVTRASDVMLDDRLVARRARTTLAGADTGVLLTEDDRGKILKPISVRVIDDHGNALIHCASRGAVALAANAQRVAILMLEPNPNFGVRLTLSGHLSPPDATNGRVVGGLCASCRANRGASDAPDIVVTLSVNRVSASCPHERPAGVPNEERTVPLAVYADAEPDLFAANIPRVVRHINAHHGEQIRRLAAHTVGVPQSHLAAASLTGLTSEQATLCWLDADGAHPAVLPFARPAPTLEELAATLRACVTAANSTES